MSSLFDIPLTAAAPDAPTSLVAATIIAVVALAGVVVYLFRFYQKRIDTMQNESRETLAGIAQERIDWAKERQRFSDASEEYEVLRDKFESQIRAEYEEKHRIVVQNYARQVSDMYEAQRSHDKQVRHEFAELMETIAQQAEDSTGKIAVVLEKFIDRYGPRNRLKG